MFAGFRSAVVLAFVSFSTGCTGAAPVPPTPQPAIGTPALPPITRPARVYVATHYSWRPNEFAFYDDGTFELVYSGQGDYAGRYKEANGQITFEWDGWSAAGPWGATGEITDDMLTVHFNVIMQLTDFEDGVYVRQR
jgi:hypothetical protein